jgi:hypothetical protein
MVRYALLGVVLVGLVAAITLAAPGPGGPGGMAGGGMGGRMGMMMGADIAAGGGNIYVTAEGKLMKLDADLKVAKSIDLPQPEMGGMMGGMMGGGGRGGGDGMAGGRGMMGGMRGRMARLAADSDHVYVLEAGKVTIYDTDLKEVKNGSIMPQQTMQPAEGGQAQPAQPPAE